MMFKRNIVGNPLNTDRINGQEFNIVRYYHNGRRSKRGCYRFRKK
ncbi:hypothetical protein [Methanobrevibacter sp.]